MSRTAAWLRSRLFLGSRLFSNLALRALGVRRPGLEAFAGNYRGDGILPVPARFRPFLLDDFQRCTSCDLCLPACGALRPGAELGFPGPRDIAVSVSRDPTRQDLNLDLLGRCDFCGLCEDACPEAIPIRAMVAHAARTGRRLREGDREEPAGRVHEHDHGHGRGYENDHDHDHDRLRHDKEAGARTLFVLPSCGGAPRPESTPDGAGLVEFIAARGARVRVLEALPACGATEYSEGRPWEARRAAFIAELGRLGARELLPLSPCCAFSLGDPVMAGGDEASAFVLHSPWGLIAGGPGLVAGSFEDAAIFLACGCTGDRSHVESVAKATGAAVVAGFCCGAWGNFPSRHEGESLGRSRRVLEAVRTAGRSRLLVAEPACRASLARVRRHDEPEVQGLAEAFRAS